MVDTISSVRGRPRRFDVEQALDVGQRLFHMHGYDGVGLAALTEALAIKPPSFYAAFGSKADFFKRVLDRYAASVLALEDILRPDRAPQEALADLLEGAARTYARDPHVRGCLVLEAARGGADVESVKLARQAAERRRDQVRVFVAKFYPEVAESVTDFVASTMSGLSASAREGLSEARLVGIAQTAIGGLRLLLQRSQESSAAAP